MWSAIGGFFTALGQALGIIKKTQELNNSPEMQARAKAEEKAKAEKKAEEVVQHGNANEAGQSIS